MAKRVRSKPHRDAIECMKHYFRVSFERAGLSWNEDNDAEIERIVDLIVAAARQDDDDGKDCE